MIEGTARAMAKGAAVATAVGFSVLFCIPAGAIDPLDHLHHGQDLVDMATAEIDGRVGALTRGPLDTEATFGSVRELLQWIQEFNRDDVGERYGLDTPRGLLVTDGIADTLATRLDDLLQVYVQRHPEEKLTRGRQALELAYAQIPMAPGRFLGFHLQHMAMLFLAQADTILHVPELRDHDAVQEGFLRHVWDLCQVYRQMHSGPVEKYQCRMRQEDWILQRTRCEKCGHRGMTFHNQMTGLSESKSAHCQEVISSLDTSREGILERFACRSWGHVFEIECPECKEIIRFSVPLPYYKVIQRGRAIGEIGDEELEKLLPDQR